MSGDTNAYQFLLVLAGCAVLFAVVPLTLARLWSKRFAPRKPGPQKNAAYECGVESRGDAWVPVQSEFYLYAILFLIFDVESVFLFPFAVAFLDLSPGAFWGMMVFLLLLAEGLAWAWVKGFFNLDVFRKPSELQ